MADTDTLPPPPTDKASYAQPDNAQRAAAPLSTAPVLSFGTPVKDEGGVFRSLYASLHDTFFPEKLPPLVLESKPIAVPDRMATKMSPKSIAASVLFYILLILIIAVLIRNHVQFAAPKQNLKILTDIPITPPIANRAEKMGGGGGQHDLAPVTQGRLPKFAQEQIVPPKAPPTIPPKIAVDPTIVMQKDLKMANNTMPNLGMPNSTLPGVSLGTGSGGGIGSGNGNGLGNGEGGNTGGGFMHAGSAQVPPKLVYQVDPDFSEEARKAKFSGNVQVYLVVGVDGRPSHIRVARAIGMGLDEKAVEAVRQYRFKPAMQNGKPVPVDLYIDVNFQIF
jgi:protein TonB